MDGGEIIGLVAVLGVIVIPSLGLTARFALKPIVESVLRLRDALDRQRTVPDTERLTRLEERVGLIQDTVDRLVDTVDFHMQLQAGGAPREALPATAIGSSGPSRPAGA